MKFYFALKMSYYYSFSFSSKKKFYNINYSLVKYDRLNPSLTRTSNNIKICCLKNVSLCNLSLKWVVNELVNRVNHQPANVVNLFTFGVCIKLRWGGEATFQIERKEFEMRSCICQNLCWEHESIDLLTFWSFHSVIKKWANPASFIVYFRSFSNKHNYNFNPVYGAWIRTHDF